MKHLAEARPIARAFVTDEAETPGSASYFEMLRRAGREPIALHRVVAMAPEVGTAFTALALALRTKAVVARDARELIILRTAQLEGGEYEFAAHREMALASGISEAQIAGLAGWREAGPDLFSPRHRAVLAYANALASRTLVADGCYHALTAHFSPAEIVELTMTAGFYAAVARFTNGLNIQHG